MQIGLHVTRQQRERVAQGKEKNLKPYMTCLYGLFYFFLSLLYLLITSQFPDVKIAMPSFPFNT